MRHTVKLLEGNAAAAAAGFYTETRAVQIMPSGAGKTQAQDALPRLEAWVASDANVVIEVFQAVVTSDFPAVAGGVAPVPNNLLTDTFNYAAGAAARIAGVTDITGPYLWVRVTLGGIATRLRFYVTLVFE